MDIKVGQYKEQIIKLDWKNRFILQDIHIMQANEQQKLNTRSTQKKGTEIEEELEQKYNKEEGTLYLSSSVGWLRIVASDRFTHIKALYLNNNNVSDSQLDKLCRLEWPKLQTLILDDNQITDTGIIHLLRPVWSSLKLLSINANPLGQKGIFILMNTPLTRLQQLSCSKLPNWGHSWMGSTTLSQLVCPLDKPSSLTKIWINNARLGSQIGKLLNKCNLPMLQQLHINDSSLNNEGLRHLTKANLHHLQFINLQNTAITAEGLLYLVGHAWASLTILRIILSQYDPFANEGRCRQENISFMRVVLMNCRNMQYGGIEYLHDYHPKSSTNTAISHILESRFMSYGHYMDADPIN